MAAEVPTGMAAEAYGPVPAVLPTPPRFFPCFCCVCQSTYATGPPAPTDDIRSPLPPYNRSTRTTITHTHNLNPP